MATGKIALPLGANNIASSEVTTPATYSPAGSVEKLLFDDTTVEDYLSPTGAVPPNYASSPVLKAVYSMVTATAGNVELRAKIKAVKDDTEDVDSASFDTANSASEAVLGTAGHLSTLSITLTSNGTMAAGDLLQVHIDRNTSTAGDATGDAEVLAAWIEYTTT